MAKNNETKLKELLLRYVTVSDRTLQYQSESFSSMDTKAQTYISILSIFMAVVFGVLALALPKFEGCHELIAKILSSVLVLSLIINIIFYFLVIKTKKFSYGYSPKELRNIDKNSLAVVDKDISDSLEVAVSNNVKVLEEKTSKMQIAENWTIMNIIVSLLYCLIFIVIL